MLEKLSELVAGHGTAKEVALRLIASHVPKRSDLLFGFDSFRDDGHVEGARERDYGRDERAAGTIIRQAADELAIDLERIDRQFREPAVKPALGIVAFPHDDAPFGGRVHVIDSKRTAYGDQTAWPGIATVVNLPANAAPMRRTRAGLPVGVQIIGPYLEDHITIAFAGLIEREFAGSMA